MSRKLLVVSFIAAILLMLGACSSTPGSGTQAQSSPGAEQAVKDAI
jgi:hypothetical protein